MNPNQHPHQHPHRASVALALRGYGFPHVWPSDLWDAGAALVPAGRLLVPSGVVDPFDEYAAWQLFARWVGLVDGCMCMIVIVEGRLTTRILTAIV